MHLYTPQHLSRLRNTDWHLQSLYDFLPQIGITVIQANFSRYVVDVNRPNIQDSLIGKYHKSAIYTCDTWHDPILSDDTADLMIHDRMSNYYQPYHNALEKILNRAKRQFGYAHLLDLHSFHGPLHESICLGSRNNKTAKTLHPYMHDALSSTFSNIANNKIFCGGFITQEYGAMDDIQALQIELRYSEYLKEGTYEGDRFPEIDSFKFEHTKRRLRQAFQEVIQSQPAKSSKTYYSSGNHSVATSLARRVP